MFSLQKLPILGHKSLNTLNDPLQLGTGGEYSYVLGFLGVHRAWLKYCIAPGYTIRLQDQTRFRGIKAIICIGREYLVFIYICPIRMIDLAQ